MTAREAALSVLYETETKDGYLNLVFAETLKKHTFSKADTAFLKELIFGVYREKLLLDFVIRVHSSLRLKKIDPRILNLLRMGVYQIYFMDKIPDHAAVSECVALSKKCARGKVPGFVNAVLRSVLRDFEKNKEIDFSSLKNDKVKLLSIKYSYPEPLTEFFINTFQDRAENIMAAGNMAPPLCVRVNTLQNSREELKEKFRALGIEAEDTPFADCGLYLSKADEAARKTLLNCFTVQDQSSQLAALSLSPEKGDTVLDLCSAPGGKTTHLAELMEDKGNIFAFDLYEARLESVKKSAERSNLTSIKTKAHDATKLLPEFLEKADKVLLDVPCSGLGIIRRKPDIKYKENITDFSSLLETQRQILSVAQTYVKPGGVLVYSTCTVNPLENREMISWFLKEFPDFKIDPIVSPHITGELKRNAESGILELFPDTENSDGFFVCRLKKQA